MNNYILDKNLDSKINNNTNNFSNHDNHLNINNQDKHYKSGTQDKYSQEYINSNLLKNNNLYKNNFDNNNCNNLYQQNYEDNPTNIDNNENNNNNYEINKFSDINEERKGEKIDILVDENNKEILSEELKNFIGEEIQEKEIEGKKVLVITKGGEKINLDILRNYEGYIIIDGKGDALLGKNSKFFIDKNSELIVSSDKKLLEGDKYIPAKIKMIKSTNLNPNHINHIKENNYGDSQNLGYSTMIGGGRTSEYIERI